MKKNLINSLRRGFTLIELLVVISIIGLLSSIVLASLAKARAKSRDSKKIQDLIQIRTALELYYTTNKYYPVTGSGNFPNITFNHNCQITSGYFRNSSNVGINNQWTNDWIPDGFSPQFLAKLPGQNPGAYNGTTKAKDCYFYMSNGTDYKVTQFNTFETMCEDTSKPFCGNAIIGGNEGYSPYNYSGTINTPGASGWIVKAPDGF